MVVKFGRHSSQRNFRCPDEGTMSPHFPTLDSLLKNLSSQTFRGRLVEVIDQAQHFAALGPSGSGAPTGDSAQSFREGLDGTERECELSGHEGTLRGQLTPGILLNGCAVFALAQESAKRTKRWYEDSDRGRRS